MPLLSIDRLSHAYGPRKALIDLSLSIAAGELFALLGPNGSGKSTLFKVLCTLIPRQSGAVHYDFGDGPVPIEQPFAIRPHLAVLFQSPSLDKQLTAYENLRHHGHLYGLQGGDLKTRIDQVLARFGLADRRDDYVKTLSGGLQRRVELAKALLTRPRLLLLDEPSTGLDPAARLDVHSALSSARQQDNVTVLLTTHLMDEAERADRVAILDQGRLVACDTPAALKSQLSGDVLTLASNDPLALQYALRERFSLEASLVASTLRLEIPAAHERLPALIEAFPGLIQSAAISKPTLDDAFIHLTGHRFENPL